MIQLDNISRNLGGKTVLCNLSMTVERGQTQVIVGASGAGKSVMLRHVIGLLTPDAGRVLIDGLPVGSAAAGDLEAVRSRFGVLFQSGALINWMNVFDNVALPLYEKTEMSDGEIRDNVMSKLELVGMQDAHAKMPAELSGGMRKRVGLARAIIRDPGVILYDEPTSGLDPVLARSIDHLICRLQDTLGVTSVVVTHDLHSAFYVGNRIAMLAEGQIEANCTPAEFARHASPTVQKFVQAQFGDQETAARFADHSVCLRKEYHES